jgi:membrane protease YdiL (CAAX protease family)
MPDRYSLPKAIGWSIAFVVLTFLLAGLLAFGVAAAIAGDSQGALAWLETNGPGATLVQAGTTIASTALATWLIGIRVLGLSLTDLRYRVPQRGTGFGFGALAGAVAAGVSLAIGAVAGGAEWVREQGTLASYAQAAATTILILAPAALGEELLFRGVPLVLLAGALGRGSAVVLLAIVFSLAHLANPNVTMLGIGNIALAGVFLGLAFYAPGGIWTAWGAHLGWNAILAALDTPVSGVPFPIPLLDYEPGDPAWLTGGPFGPEGGLASTIALTIAVLVAGRWAGKDSA